MPDNEWVYWNKMQPLRDQGFGLLLPQSNPDRQLGPFDSPRLQWNLQAGPQAFEYIYPHRYYEWVQDYLTTAIRNKPPGNASKGAKVYWALDVWTHLTYGLLTLGLPLWLYPGKPSQEGAAHGSMQWKSMAAIDQVNDRFITALRRYYNGAGNAAAVIGPAPFMEYPFIWNRAFSVGKNIGGSTSGHFGDYAGWWATASGDKRSGRWSIDNVVANTLCYGVIPQMIGGFNVTSWGDKDKFDMQTLAQFGNLPALMATFQWRLYSIRDWAPKRRAPLPKGMGQWGDGRMVRLSQYINSLNAESSQSEVWQPAGQDMGSPNFAHAFNKGIVPYVQTLRGVNMQQVDKRAVSTWIGLATPLLDDSGNLVTNAAKGVRQPDGSTASLQIRQPLTKDDWSDLQKNSIKRVKDRSRAAATEEGMRQQLAAQGEICSPEIPAVPAKCVGDVCTPAIEGVEEQCAGWLSLYDSYWETASDIPIFSDIKKYWFKLFQWMDSWAVGCVAPQQVRDVDTGEVVMTSGCTLTETWFFALPDPFFRSLGPPFSTWANGSSKDVGARVIFSIVAAEAALNWDLGVYGAGWTPEQAAAVAAKPSQAAIDSAAVMQWCNATYIQWNKDNPARSQCITANKMGPRFFATWMTVCGAVVRQEMPVEQGLATLEQAATDACKGGGGGLWRAFVEGMVESPNPVELLRR